MLMLTLGIFIGLAAGGCIDIVKYLWGSDSPQQEPPRQPMPDNRQILHASGRAGQIIWIRFRTRQDLVHKINPN